MVVLDKPCFRLAFQLSFFVSTVVSFAKMLITELCLVSYSTPNTHDAVSSTSKFFNPGNIK